MVEYAVIALAFLAFEFFVIVRDDELRPTDAAYAYAVLLAAVWPATLVTLIFLPAERK